MSRSYSPTNLVVLPRLTALSTARLMAELLNAAAAEQQLPGLIAADCIELQKAREVLLVELGQRLEGEEPPGVRPADRAEDNAFGALSDWLLSFARLPASRHAAAAEAKAIHDALFPTGLTFLNIRAADEWQEAETRLRAIKDKGLDATILSLGGKPFLDELHAAHAAYGEALGITAKKPAPEAPRLRAARDAAQEVVRSYVLRVAAHARPSEPATVALTNRLLAPLVGWKDKPQKTASANTEEMPPSSPV